MYQLMLTLHSGLLSVFSVFVFCAGRTVVFDSDGAHSERKGGTGAPGMI